MQISHQNIVMVAFLLEDSNEQVHKQDVGH